MWPDSIHNKNVLFSPLNWGFGHVSRSISLLQQLLNQGCELHVACTTEHKMIYQEYFKDLKFIDFEGYPFRFGGNGNFASDLARSFFQLKKRVRSEQKEVEEFVRKLSIDVVISDHRFGFRSKHVPSIIVIHQVNLPVKWYHFGISAYHRNLLRRFNYQWIMDYSDSRLAGELSKNKLGASAMYIGPYSRFSLYDPVVKSGKAVLVVSGPLIYGQQLIDQVRDRYTMETLTIVASDQLKVPEGFRPAINCWREQDQLLLIAPKLISRSGYSTLLDLEVLQCGFELIPTPGQFEQEYLFELHH